MNVPMTPDIEWFVQENMHEDTMINGPRDWGPKNPECSRAGLHYSCYDNLCSYYQPKLMALSCRSSPCPLKVLSF